MIKIIVGILFGAGVFTAGSDSLMPSSVEIAAGSFSFGLKDGSVELSVNEAPKFGLMVNRKNGSTFTVNL